ncbi:hypothetical protein D2T29_11690 [Sinirhodobacter populi]|uniref:DUF2497 domain-containing protein n=1 Tax=Paenirhodobacter populi TaxID=2306993 RepID=A0A443KDG0_9RHOB|nr:hypothetical protein [Sinirhodobacter populi]RWR30810.1 hypothetical protein D2T29_11690 [Sinirhodobacter populi]
MAGMKAENDREIEDVLASIRRLVSQDSKPEPRPAVVAVSAEAPPVVAQPDADTDGSFLLLTPAQRIGEAPQTAPVPPAESTLVDELSRLENSIAEMEASVSAASADLPERAPVAEIAETNVISIAPAPRVQVEAPREVAEAKAPVAEAVEEVVASAPVAAQEPAGVPQPEPVAVSVPAAEPVAVAEPEPAGAPALTTAPEDVGMPAELEADAEPEAASEAEPIAASAVVAELEPAAEPEVIAEAEPVAASVPAVEAGSVADEPVEEPVTEEPVADEAVADEPMTEEAIAEEPRVGMPRFAIHRGGIDEDLRAPFQEVDDEEDQSELPGIDEDALRVLVARLIREELQGVLGQKITQNVRKLVRREIQRSLIGTDFE